MQTALIVSLCIGLALAGCTAPSTAGSDNETRHGGHTGSHMASHDQHSAHLGMAHVIVRDGSYDPAQVNASQDGGIHFTNDGQQTHTVTIVDERAQFVFDQAIEPGKAVHFQPPATGAYHAFCRLHDGMDADLQVS